MKKNIIKIIQIFAIFCFCTVFIYLNNTNSNQKFIIQNSNTIQGQAVVGKPIKWIKEVSISEIKKGNHILAVPAIAKNIKIVSSLNNFSSINLLQISRNELSKKSALINRSEQFIQSISFSKIINSLSVKISKLFADVSDVLIGSSTPDTTTIDLSASSSPVADLISTTVDNSSTSSDIISISTDISTTTDNSTTTSSSSTISSDTVSVTYETPAPTITEASTDTGKVVTISAQDIDTQITNVLAYTNIPEIYKVGQEDKIKIKWSNNNDQNVTFKAYDLNGNGKLDYIEWIVPHLSTQTFDIIFISKAFELDQNKEIINDIYDNVSSKDQNYATIPANNYVRTTFSSILDNTRNITLFAKPTVLNTSVSIKVFPVYVDGDGNQEEGPELATVNDGTNPDFSNLDHDGKYRILLTNLETPTDVFDLKVTGSLDVDYVVDPATLIWDPNGVTAGQNDGTGAWLGTNLWYSTTTATNTTWVSGSDAVFGNGGAGGAVTLSTATTVNSIYAANYTGTYTLGQTGNAIILNSGITLDSGGGALTIVSPLTLGGAQSWTNNSSNAITISSTTNAGSNLLTLNVTGTGKLNINGSLSGAAGLTKTGTGLAGFGSGVTNTYTGTTTVSGGVLMVGSPPSYSSDNLILNGGVFEHYSSDSFTRALGSGAGQVQILGGASGFSENGNTSMTVTLNSSAATEAVWGSTYFNPSPFVLQASSAQGMGTNVLNFANNVDLNGADRTVYVDGGTTGGAIAVMNGVIRNSSGTAGIIKTGAGKLALSGANTFNGNLTIKGGILQIGNNSAGTLTGGTYSGNIFISPTSTLQVWSTAANTLTGVISGGGGISKACSGTLTLSGNNTYTGQTVLSSFISGPGTLQVYSFNSVNGGTPLMASSSLGAPTTVASGTIPIGNIANQISNTLRYLGAGETTDRVLNPVFNGNDSQWIDASGSGLLKFTSNMVITQGTGNSIGQLIFTGTGNGEMAGVIPVLNESITKNGNGNWTLSGNNTFNSPVSVNSGSGTLFLTGINSYTGTTTANGILSINSIADYGVNSAIGKGTTSVPIIVGGNNSTPPTLIYTGGTASTDRQITIGYSGGSTGGNIYNNGTGPLTFTASTFNVAPGGVFNRTMTLGGTYSGSSNVISGNITNGATGTIAVTKKADSSIWTFTGTNTYTGTTTISGGTLIIGDGVTDGSIASSSNIVDNANLVYNLISSRTYANTISGTGTLSKIGNGAFTLSGINAYTGITTISTGTLALSNASNNNISSTNIINIANGATLNTTGLSGSNLILSSVQTIKGTGNIIGNMTVGSGSTISPGNSPGTINQTGNVTYAGGGNYVWEVNNTTATGTAGINWDLESITGALNITATSGNKFNINITSLTAGNVSGNVPNFDKYSSYTWTIASTSAGISGFATSSFNLITTNFTNDISGTSNNGYFSIQVSGNNLQIVYNAANDTYTLSYIAGSHGSIMGSTTQIVSYGGSGSLVIAVPNTGYHFVNWSDASTSNPRTDTNVISNISVTANFATSSYLLSYVAGSNGTISGSSTQSVLFQSTGTSVTAVPNTGYHFTSWSDGATTTTRTDIATSSDQTFTANFAINVYSVTYTSGANGNLVGSTTQSVNYGENGTQVTAVPNTGYHFLNWSDASTSNPRTDTNVISNISVTANFAINTYTLSYSTNSNGSLSGLTTQIINYGSNGSTITAVPNTYYHFGYWSDGLTTANRTDLNITSDLSLTASFILNPSSRKYALFCTSFDYSEWSDCSNGYQTRQITNAYPQGCDINNGNNLPVTSQLCASYVSLIPLAPIIVPPVFVSNTTATTTKIITPSIPPVFIPKTSTSTNKKIFVPAKPRFIFLKDLKIKDNNNDVKELQYRLKLEGLFNVDITGYFGFITKKAVEFYQQKYFSEILTPLKLTKPTGYTGYSTRRKLNK